MRKPWSITTTLRNPDRLWDFLYTLKSMDGEPWNTRNQQEFQVLLIKNRLYKPNSINLNQSQVELLKDHNRNISRTEAKQIFLDKRYKDPPMRGRQSTNPLKKFGLATFENNIVSITDLGNQLLEHEYEFADVFFKMLLKWQIPNPYNIRYFKTDDYNIKPFIGTLHLIREVNRLEASLNRNQKGISRGEFCTFVPTLIHHRDIKKYAENIVNIRLDLEATETNRRSAKWMDHRRSFLSDFVQSQNQRIIDNLIKSLNDYGDNAIRYFRVTRYIQIRGGGYYIDLEHQRSIQLDLLLESDDGRSESYSNYDQFLRVIVNNDLPRFPWDTRNHQEGILRGLESVVQQYELRLNLSLTQRADTAELSDVELKHHIDFLSTRRKDLQNTDRYQTAQLPDSIRENIRLLEGIYNQEQRSILLEKTTSLGLCAFNDAIDIVPRYPVGDDNEPTNTAPGNGPDIECFYDSFNAICEVTFLRNRTQWYNEGQPVMRHLRDFESKHPDKPAYCIFIAPSMHVDTINTFLVGIKYGYEGDRIKIAPITISQFVGILEVICQLREDDQFFPHTELRLLFDEIIEVAEHTSESRVWLQSIATVIDKWKEKLAS